MRFGICHSRTLTITLIGAAILSIGPAWAEGQHDLAKASQTPAPFPAKLEKECRWHRVADGSVTRASFSSSPCPVPQVST